MDVRLRTLWGCCLATGAILLVSVPATGQVRGAAQYSRPSDLSPSQRIGRVGGYLTQREVRQLGGSQSGVGAGQPHTYSTRQFGTGRDVQPAMLNRGAPRPAGMGSYTRPLGGMGPTQYAANVGMRTNFGRGGRLAAASGFKRATDFSITPLAASMINAPPVFETPPTLPASEGTAYHQFFGVQPAVASKPRAARDDQETLGQAMQAVADQRVAALAARALREFAAGTAETEAGSEQWGALRNAATLLEAVANTDRERDTVLLLVAHASIAKERVGSAVTALHAAVERNPQIFVETTNLASFFGDYDEHTDRSEFLRRQMLRIRPTGDRNRTSVPAQIITAYASWALGDFERCRVALDRMDALLEGRDAPAQIEAFAAAMRAALTARTASSN